MSCPTCGHDPDVCAVCKKPRQGMDYCADCEPGEEIARIQAIATLIGVDWREVNFTTLGAAARVAGCEWHEVTPARLAGKETAARAEVAAELARTGR